jgi:hypothetical protein
VVIAGQRALGANPTAISLGAEHHYQSTIKGCSRERPRARSACRIVAVTDCRTDQNLGEELDLGKDVEMVLGDVTPSFLSRAVPDPAMNLDGWETPEMAPAAAPMAGPS